MVVENVSPVTLRCRVTQVATNANIGSYNIAHLVWSASGPPIKTIWPNIDTVLH